MVGNKSVLIALFVVALIAIPSAVVFASSEVEGEADLKTLERFGD